MSRDSSRHQPCVVPLGQGRGQEQPSGAACAPRGKRGEGWGAATDGGAPHLPRQRLERLECALFCAPDLHPGHLRCAFYRRGDKLVACYQVRSRRPNVPSDSSCSPILPSVACARRSDSLTPFPTLYDVRHTATSRAPRSEFRETTPGFRVSTT